jgi:putative membrane protein
MLDEALAAYAHFLSLFVTVAMLAAEAALYRRRMAAAALALLRRLDLGYMLGAIAILVTGGLRVFFYAKGPAFYAANPVFWAKLALFVAVGLLSVPPTRHYIASARSLRDGELVVEEAVFGRIRRCIAAELALIALIPLAAALMARGFGM